MAIAGGKHKAVVGILVGLTLMTGGGAWADLDWEALQETSGGPQGSTQTVKTYYSATASRVETGSSVMIIDYARMTSYQLDPAKKTFMEVDLNRLTEGPGEQEDGGRARDFSR